MTTLVHEWLHWVARIPHRGKSWFGRQNPASSADAGDPEAVMHWQDTGGAHNEINRIERGWIPSSAFR
jgi:hypothetical protein